MKTLLLMRHGKSSWKDTKKDEDRLRPLAKKGLKDAQKMGAFLEEKGFLPQVLMTSTAKRARDTACIFLELCCNEVTFIALDALYMAEPAAVIEALRVVPDRDERVMVIGHNPGLESLLQHLTGEVESLPTASVAYFELPLEHWSELSLDTRAQTWEKWKPKDA